MVTERGYMTAIEEFLRNLRKNRKSSSEENIEISEKKAKK